MGFKGLNYGIIFNIYIYIHIYKHHVIVESRSMTPRFLGLGTLDDGVRPALRPDIFTLEGRAAVHVGKEAKGVPGWSQW